MIAVCRLARFGRPISIGGHPNTKSATASVAKLFGHSICVLRPLEPAVRSASVGRLVCWVRRLSAFSTKDLDNRHCNGMQITMDIPTQERAYPPTWRIVAAFAIVPGVAALLLAVLSPAYDGLSDQFERIWRSALAFAVFGAYPATVVLGLPAFFMLRRHFDPKIVNCSLTGAVVASLPWFVLSTFSLPDSASIDGQATVIDGSLTAYG